MCEFISWIEDGKNILFLDDSILFSKKTKEALKGSKDNDFLGHGAIRQICGVKNGQDRELKDFWKTDQLPEALRSKLKNFQFFKTNFGRMLTEYAQLDDLDYIIQNAPKDDPKWQGLTEFCSEIKASRLTKDLTTEEHKTNVRYDLTVDELVKKAKFDWANNDVTDQNFPEPKGESEKKDIILVHLNQCVSSEDVLSVLGKLNLRPANAKELLSLAIDHPDLQRGFPIVALGSAWRSRLGGRSVPCLRRDGSERWLFLVWSDGGWGGGCRFAAVRK